ncbi:MAG: serine hydrolase [Clostridiales bacterium]|nr:serine hydrolase [Clostridiales bacterium]HAW16584.1 hypothetical protein [Clostridiales bacterium]
MKRPNPTFLTKAVEIREKRHHRARVIIIVLVVLTLLTVFILKVASMQKLYKEEYPELVGAGTSTAGTTEESEEETRETSEATETADTTEETTEQILAPVVATETTVQTEAATESTAQNNSPDPFTEAESVTFRSSYPLQTISHEDRDVRLDDLKQSVTDYINSNPGERIAFRYINLSSNETLGINDLEPIVPAGSFSLPISIAFRQRINNGWNTDTATVTYQGEDAPEGSSYIADTYESGKQFYLRTCQYLALTRNDNLALSYMLNAMGGIENNWTTIGSISSYINYTESIIYRDRNDNLQRGPHRSSVYDMAAYAEYLYINYINYPDVYQSIINDMSESQMPTGFSTAFAEGTLILHVSGRNVDYEAYTDVAIIDAEEPVVLVVYCECASADRAATIQADLATYVARYLTYCHS